MSKRIDGVRKHLRGRASNWLITGVAGFIGSNLLQELLELDQLVVGIDNFSTGKEENLKDVQHQVSSEQWARFTFVKGDVRDLQQCRDASREADHVLHQAALGSVPRSIDDPISSNETNINGFLNMLVAAKDHRVKSFTYAASSSTYGDHPGLPKVESTIGNPLSPYAVTKYVNELYASVFAQTYGFKSIGLRYFNVFGRRQDPDGPYAAVIPRWIGAMIDKREVRINGDGATSRDFCFIENVIQANLLAATASEESRGQVFNVAAGASTSLNQLFSEITKQLDIRGCKYSVPPAHAPFRPGDIRHSLADIRKAKDLLGYMPTHSLTEGLCDSVEWYLSQRENKGQLR